MYAKLHEHELAERLSGANTGVEKDTWFLVDRGFCDYASLHELLKEFLITKGYEEEKAELSAESVLRKVAKSLLTEGW